MSEIDELCMRKYGVKLETIKSSPHRLRSLIMHLVYDLNIEIEGVTNIIGFKKVDTIYKYISDPNIKWKPTEKQINQYKKFLGIEHV